MAAALAAMGRAARMAARPIATLRALAPSAWHAPPLGQHEEKSATTAARPSKWPLAPFFGGAMLTLPTACVAATEGAGSTAIVTAAGYSLSPAALTLLSTAGPVCFLFLQAAGAKTAVQIVRDKSTGQMSMLPFASLVTNCAIWTWYGVLLQDSTVMLPNASGLLVGLACSGIFLKYTTKSQLPMVAGSGLIVASVSAAALTMPAAEVLPYIGYLGDVLAVILMASPLATMSTVLKERSTRSMPFGISLATFCNGVGWFGYGYFVLADPLIWAPNLLGIAAATLQLSLFARFGFSK